MANNCKYHCTKGRVFLEATRRFVDCPECRDITKQLQLEDDNCKTIADKLYIPMEYRSAREADIDSLFKVDMIKYCTSDSVQKVKNRINELAQSIYNDTPIKESNFLFVPSFIDIDRFIYSTQLMASIQKGLNVSPFISLNTLYGLIKLSDFTRNELEQIKVLSSYNTKPDIVDARDAANFVEETNKTYSDFIHADICFLRATACTKEGGWEALADILDERSRRNKATIVFSHWSTANKNTNGLRFMLSDANKLRRLKPVELISNNSKRLAQQYTA